MKLNIKIFLYTFKNKFDSWLSLFCLKLSHINPHMKNKDCTFCKGKMSPSKTSQTKWILANALRCEIIDHYWYKKITYRRWMLYLYRLTWADTQTLSSLWHKIHNIIWYSTWKNLESHPHQYGHPTKADKYQTNSNCHVPTYDQSKSFIFVTYPN